MRRSISVAVRVTTVLTTLFAFLSSVRVAAQRTDPLVRVEEVVVTPTGKGDTQPTGLAPGTLCSLRVKLRNAGTQKASSFGFIVRINGKQESTYDKILYVQAIDPGTTGKVTLNNFYSPEPQVKDGKVAVEVTLREARWMEIKKEGEAQTWVPTGDVKDLPSSKSISIPFTAGPK